MKTGVKKRVTSVTEKGRQPVPETGMALMVAYVSLMEIQYELTRGLYVGLPFDRMQLAIQKALPDHLRDLAMQRALDYIEKQRACPDCKGENVVGNKACGTCIACGNCRGCGWVILDLKGNTEPCLTCEETGYRK